MGFAALHRYKPKVMPSPFAVHLHSKHIPLCNIVLPQGFSFNFIDSYWNANHRIDRGEEFYIVCDKSEYDLNYFTLIETMLYGVTYQ
jgi:hypothetical protein